jgi:LmbE family N-acetylglucosaminyl deacetylase
MSQPNPGSGDMSPKRSRLVVAPHAGDETVGCGGMLAKYCDDSAVVVLAGLEEDRKVQFRTAQHMLGGPTSVLLGLPPQNVGEDMDRLVGLLADLLALMQPRELYLPFPSVHQDRLAAYEAGLRSTCVPSRLEVRPPLSVLVYDVAAADPADYPADVRWNVREPLGELDVDRKVAAAIAYRSPVADGLKKRAQAVGSAGRVSWAEQFALVRAPRGLGERRLAPSHDGARAMVGGLR